MKKSANLALRIPPEIKEALEDAARADRRSVSAYVEMLIVNDLDSKGFLPRGEAK
jgi:hypothetical protein